MKTFSVKNFDRFQHYKDRAPPWIKLYNELLDDYEFGLLPDATKMHLIAIWLLASRSENKIPYDPKWVARRINANDVVDLKLLADRGFILLDQTLQTTDQVASNVQAECLSREETEKSREEEEADTRPVAKATRPIASDRFDEFWQEYPRRDGPNPRKPAEQKFSSLVKSGLDPQTMIDGARKLANDERARGNIGTRFIPQAVTWLNQQRWSDHAATAMLQALAASERISTKVHVKADSPQWQAWARHLGKQPPQDRDFGWFFDSEWPPGHEHQQSQATTH